MNPPVPSRHHQTRDLKVSAFSETAPRSVLGLLIQQAGIRPLHWYFEKHVAENPQALALVAPSQSWDYTELNAAANRIAHTILHRGITGDARVMLVLERDALAVAAILGVLKSGNAYVPVDPEFPVPRIRYIAEDTQSALILTDSKHLGFARQLAGSATAVINLEELSDTTPTDNPCLLTTSDQLAFLIYTSGSTGQPKGVIHQHASILGNLRNYAEGHRLRADDRLTLLFSIAVGASTTDIFSALLNGASIHVFNLKREGFGKLADWLSEQKMTVYHSIASVFRRLCESLNGGEKLASLRSIDLAGEPVYRRDVELFKEHCADHCQLVNHLAATESNVIAMHHINKATELSGNLVPAGYAVEGNRLLILDDQGNPLPAGEVGELAVSSPCLSPGYWNQPELTAASFSQDADDPQRRIYRTGDLGRLSADGLLEHLGRKDSRVKVRGFSVEVAEVENALLELEAIDSAIVIGRKTDAGEDRLLAYYVVTPTCEIAPTDLREAMAKKLPAHMIPAFFLPLAELPLLPNGKIDRQALPSPETFTALDRVATPLTEKQARLIGLMEPVLKVRGITADDNFFDLGGDSLSAIELLAAIEKEFGNQLSPSIFFQYSTIGQLAESLGEGEKERPFTFLVTLNARGVRPPFFCVHNVGGGIFGYRALARELGADRPFYAFRAQNPEQRQPYYFTIAEMAARYLTELRVVQPVGPYYLGGHSFGGLLAYEMAQQLVAAGERVALVVLFDTFGPGYPKRLPLRQVLGIHWKHIKTMRPTAAKQYLKEKLNLEIVFRRAMWQASYRWPFLHNELATALRDDLSAAHLRAAQEYEFRTYPGPVAFFRAREVRETCYPDARLGWGAMLNEQWEVFDVPGKHTTIIDEPLAHQLAKKLAAVLESRDHIA